MRRKDKKFKILLTSGASCPDAEVEKVINKLLSFYPQSVSIDEMITKVSTLSV